MSHPDQQLLSAFEGHDVEAVRAALDSGADACSVIDGKAAVYRRLEENTRSDRQVGLLPQVHRKERDVYTNIQAMLEAAERLMPPLTNVPNRYLEPK
jgi:hypothetical protein